MAHVRRQLAISRDDATFKVRPTFPPFKDEEYRPSQPCVQCFTEHTSDRSMEQLGVANMFLARGGTLKNKFLCYVLDSFFHSMQVHRGEFEYVHQVNHPVIFVSQYQSPWDFWILSFLVHSLKKNPVFLNNLSAIPNVLSNLLTGDKENLHQIIRILFINLDDSEQQLSSVFEESGEHKGSKFIPVSVCYEFMPNEFNLKPLLSAFWISDCEVQPKVRVNFGQDHYCSAGYAGKGGVSKSESFVKHLIHEIWKNTAIMAFHISSLAQYRPKLNGSQNLDEMGKFINEFQKEFRREHDVAFIGHADEVGQYCVQLMSSKIPLALCSKAVDLLKDESIMMKAVLSAIDWNDVDWHNETLKASNSAVMDNFRVLRKILEQEIEYIHQPCTDSSVIEKRAMEILHLQSIISYHSDEFSSAENVLAQRMARNLDLEFQDDDEEDWANSVLPQDTTLYINIKNLLDRKWVSNIADRTLEVYYAAAKQLLEFSNASVTEAELFVNSVLQSLEKNCSDKDSNSEHWKKMVYNSLKLFTKLEIIDSYRHSGIKVIYLKNPHSNEDQLLQLIDEIVQFMN